MSDYRIPLTVESKEPTPPEWVNKAGLNEGVEMINHQQLREAQRMAAAAVRSGSAKQWEEAKQLFRKATGRILH